MPGEGHRFEHRRTLKKHSVRVGEGRSCEHGRSLRDRSAEDQGVRDDHLVQTAAVQAARRQHTGPQPKVGEYNFLNYFNTKNNLQTSYIFP